MLGRFRLRLRQSVNTILRLPFWNIMGSNAHQHQWHENNYVSPQINILIN